jgi:hypothetical protein
VLGKSELKKITNTALYYATGNNLIFTGDINRRAMRCIIDPKCERPEERKNFQTVRPDKAFAAQRAELVAAGLTVLRAFCVAGQPTSGLQPVGSFEDWSAWVRNCLVWLGEPDPWRSTEAMRGEDPVLANNIAALDAWYEKMNGPVTAKEVYDKAIEKIQQFTPGQPPYRFLNPELQDALRLVTGNDMNTTTLGRWISHVKDRPFGGYVLKLHGLRKGINRWQVFKIDNEAYKNEPDSSPGSIFH